MTPPISVFTPVRGKPIYVSEKGRCDSLVTRYSFGSVEQGEAPEAGGRGERVFPYVPLSLLVPIMSMMALPCSRVGTALTLGRYSSRCMCKQPACYECMTSCYCPLLSRVT